MAPAAGWGRIGTSTGEAAALPSDRRIRLALVLAAVMAVLAALLLGVGTEARPMLDP